eukprot:SAG31_NODE_11148_length_1061_cov_0.778586_1_plen_83_part_10
MLCMLVYYYDRFRSTLPLAIRRLLTDHCITDVVVTIIRDSGGMTQLRRQARTAPANAITKSDVLAVKKYLRGACVSPVDKGAG